MGALSGTLKVALLRALTRGRSRAAATSKMELLVIIVNGWKPLIIITKSSIFDVAAFLDPHLIDVDSPYKNQKIPQNS